MSTRYWKITLLCCTTVVGLFAFIMAAPFGFLVSDIIRTSVPESWDSAAWFFPGVISGILLYVGGGLGAFISVMAISDVWKEPNQ